jgi:ABC-type uncharacterized transport system permease subunit
MPSILLQPPFLHLLAAALYVGLAVHFWRSRWHGAVLNQPVTGLLGWERVWLGIALFCHGLTLGMEIFPGEGFQMRFGFAVALSLMTWLAMMLYWFESFYARMEGLQMLGLPLATFCVLLPWQFPGQHIVINTNAFAFKLHFLVAMMAYSLFTLAVLHAVLMAFTEQHLHRGRLTPLFAGLPPLMKMEAILFRLINISFSLLTLTLFSGVVFSEQLFGKAFPINHKTVFAFLSWMIFGALIIGRYRYGWRGKKALRWTLSGFSALLLAYIGSRFVIEIILGRTA